MQWRGTGKALEGTSDGDCNYCFGCDMIADCDQTGTHTLRTGEPLGSAMFNIAFNHG